MKGVVIATNPKLGRVAVLTDEGYSIFDVLGDDLPERGSEIRWAGSTPLGSERVQDLSRGASLDVFFENHHVSKAILRQQMGL